MKIERDQQVMKKEGGKMTVWKIAGWILLVGTFIGGLLLLNHMNGPVPTHWNLSGHVDGYSEPWVVAIVFPVGNILFYLFLLAIPKIDPRKENYQVFQKTYELFVFSIIGFTSAIIWISLLRSVNVSIDTIFWTRILLAILMFILGNGAGKLRNNYFIGVRTPWTLANETVWNKTHQLFGKLMVVSGLLSFIGAFLPNAVGFAVLIGTMIASSLIAAVYSYWIFHSIQSHG